MSKSTGGPAFPVRGQPMPGGQPGALAGQLFHGMTLRDYFAAQALKGQLSHPKTINPDGPENCAILAKVSFELADAMMQERSK